MWGTFIDQQSSEETTQSFAVYAAPYFKPETCPHFIRYRQEGKDIGHNHLSQCGSPLDKHILKDSVFSKRAIAMIKCGDLLDLRRGLQAASMGVSVLLQIGKVG